MRFRVVMSRLLGGLCGWAAYVTLAVPAAQAQGPILSGPCSDCSQPAPSPLPSLPNQPLMPRADQTAPTSPAETPTNPTETPTNPGQPATNPGENNANLNEANNNQENSNFDFSGSQGLASGAGSFSSPGGYIDDAIPQTVFKLRFDAEDGINRFDRADYLFGTWREGSFHTHALVGGGAVRGTFLDPKATGSQIISNAVDDKLLTAALEYAFSQRLSVFAEVPFQFVHFGPDIEDGPESAAERRQFPETEVRNPKQDPDGLGDIQFGFKYALIAEPDCRYLTFQFRTYVPSGDSGLGLGTGHVSVEPGLLAFQRLNDRTVIQGELTDWIPLSAGQGAGNVVEYGAGIGYDVIQRPGLRVTPVAEVVGWTCLGGTEGFDGTVPAPTVTTPTGVTAVNVNGTIVPDDHGFLEANGDTIVNLKFGVRTYVGERSDFYLGYGRSVTGSRWYQDIASVEYRLHF